ncbi:MAG: bacillithiol biosynthesis cysteine-adding enzyme BshC [Bacteroidota bacterium]|jgi:bacillithiol biosynthesis cysteine-adding enzyme BshC
MDHNLTCIPYEATGYFSKIVTDYLAQSNAVKPFFEHNPDYKGIRASIAARQQFDTPRALLVKVLTSQYAGQKTEEKVNNNIRLLADAKTFTVTTAHQPNIFTGPLYFIYKIIQTIRLAEELSVEMPEFNFVPVYYMGSEDADLDEIGHANIGGQKIVWETKQAGAVGRMKVDAGFVKLIHAINGQIAVQPFGKALTDLFLQSYSPGKTIQDATLALVHALFGQYGLLVLIPDNAALKAAYQPVIAKELTEQFSHQLVAETIAEIGKEYKVQAGGREINLFYLLDDKRERIEKSGELYTVNALNLSFSQEEILAELKNYPDRFSANVILRGAFQETILPNIAFIGGGGEIAYWLELKKVFQAANIPYPVLLLRNSFLLITKEQEAKWQELNFSVPDFFEKTFDLTNQLVMRESANSLQLTDELAEAKAFYAKLQTLAIAVDKTLAAHVQALETKALHRLTELEKKMLRAEKRKFETSQKRLEQLKGTLFPANSLQERVENFSLYYAKYGNDWIKAVCEASSGISRGFAVLRIG